MQYSNSRFVVPLDRCLQQQQQVQYATPGQPSTLGSRCHLIQWPCIRILACLIVIHSQSNCLCPLFRSFMKLRFKFSGYLGSKSLHWKLGQKKESQATMLKVQVENVLVMDELEPDVDLQVARDCLSSQSTPYATEVFGQLLLRNCHEREAPSTAHFLTADWVHAG